ncbi:hypothetical protein JVT61DRAFT_9156 [Boletus reticuloceps]|uniref:Uncharacterized protein n=1 Tax=Boletus reticuloceps TaxID=495285 RepID=A0A8I2YGV7_9AGAM|nr:hypothetical protein JVT61DRAFT_9156 [Boletus reticuloceps]
MTVARTTTSASAVTNDGYNWLHHIKHWNILAGGQAGERPGCNLDSTSLGLLASCKGNDTRFSSPLGFKLLLLSQLTYPAARRTSARNLGRIFGTGRSRRGNPWTWRPATACTLLFRICNTHGRERGNGYYEYESHFLRQSTMVANDKVGIRVTDVTLGWRRLPVDFYAVVHHSGLEWRTENKSPSMHDDVVEWDGSPIPM